MSFVRDTTNVSGPLQDIMFHVCCTMYAATLPTLLPEMPTVDIILRHINWGKKKCYNIFIYLVNLSEQILLPYQVLHRSPYNRSNDFLLLLLLVFYPKGDNIARRQWALNIYYLPSFFFFFRLCCKHWIYQLHIACLLIVDLTFYLWLFQNKY